MRSNPQVEEQVPLTLQIFTAEESFRERRRAIRLHRYLTRISTLALNAAWAVGLLAIGLTVGAILLGLLGGQ